MASAAPVAEHHTLERLYEENPSAYRRRVRGLIWLGYGYIAACLLVIVGFVVGGGLLFASGHMPFGLVDNFLQIGIPAIAVAGLMIRAVFVRIPPPEGIYLTGDLKQRVLDFFEPVRVAAGGRNVDEVVIVDEVNAAVQQQPRWGLFGPVTNYLIIGAPMFHVMSPSELKAVIAHEFGHLSHAHGRMGASVYRLDHTLRHAAHAIHEKAQSGLAEFSFRFFHWFYPRFETVTFAMRRGQEYEADRVAAEATSAQAIASSLCRLYSVDSTWGRYWNEVWSSARTQPDNAAIAPYRDLAKSLPPLEDRAAGDAAVAEALEQETDFADTHPCLRDRLAALNMAPDPKPIPDETALDAIFPAPEREALLQLLDDQWRRDSGPHWQDRHASYSDAEAERDRLRDSLDALEEDETLRLASLQESLDGVAMAVPTYRHAVERFPESPTAHFHWARVNLDEDFATAERSFLACVERDPEWIPSVTEAVQPEFELQGRRLEESAFAPHIDRYRERVRQANEERESVDAGDDFVPHRLDDAQLAELRAFLERFPEIRSAELMEKIPQLFPNHRIFMLGFNVRVTHRNVGGDPGAWISRMVEASVEALPRPCSPFGVVLTQKSPWRETFGTSARHRVYERHLSGGQRIVEGLYTLGQWFSLLTLLVLVGVLLYLGYGWISG